MLDKHQRNGDRTVCFPPKLTKGDEIRVLAISRSLAGVMQMAGVNEHDIQFATSRLETLGLKVTFGRWVKECNAHLTASPEHRLEDFHEAIGSPSVKAILAVSGGVGAIQLIDDLDYGLVAAHPKILCGYSDITYLCNAIYARTTMTTYNGPNFTSFMMRRGADYTITNFRRCLFENFALPLQPVEKWSDDPWQKDQDRRTFDPNEGFWAIQEGQAEGTIIGGTYSCLNSLQGSAYFPPLQDAILFLEQPAAEFVTLWDLDSGLRALAMQPGFSGVRAIVLGRFGRIGRVMRENLTALIGQIPALKHLPVIANCDFGHTTPIITFPVGGRCQLIANNGHASVTITDH